MREPSKRKRAAALAFGVLLIALFAISAIAIGLGHPEPGDGEIAVVEGAPDGTITEEEYQRALEQTAKRDPSLGGEVPSEDDPNYEVVRDTAINDLLLARWIRGEAEDRGIEVTQSEVDDELESIIEQQFNGSRKQFDRFVEEAGFTDEEARQRVELQVLSGRFQEAIVPQEVPISDDEIAEYYEENKQQFEQPEARDVRQILVEDRADAERAAEELREDPSERNWERLAEELSLDEATKNRGGLRRGVTEGSGTPELDAEVFSAPEGEVVGPFETEEGFYVFQVENVTPPETTSLDEAAEQIRQTLTQARQQQLGAAFEEDFLTKWSSRTFCAEGFRVARCANADAPPDPCNEELAESTGCGAPVPSTRPIAPGTASVFGTPSPPGRPQGPITPTPAGATEGLPPGLSPVPGGGAPPGAAPPAPPPGG